ncbi:hypothetical protein VTN77DRAFT_1490 [Rasamsonia byssochlamydoides]|uniref:uncharacterized protein n=1 Tax=Rasamsonia byssochlamydoides TaxID=89139 RepID=UPI003743C4E4
MPVIPSDPENSPAASSSRDDRGTSSDPASRESRKGSARAHLTKGPHIPDNMPPKASREELEVRKKELNK